MSRIFFVFLGATLSGLKSTTKIKERCIRPNTLFGLAMNLELLKSPAVYADFLYLPPTKVVERDLRLFQSLLRPKLRQNNRNRNMI